MPARVIIAARHHHIAGLIMSSGFAAPVIVWVCDETRARLRELSEARAVPLERFAGHLLEGAVANYASSGPQVQPQEPDKAAKRRSYTTPRGAEGTARARRR